MNVKHQPGTKLPWFPRQNTDGQCVVGALKERGGFAFPLEAQYEAPNGAKDVAYAVQAANAYPKLIENLKALRQWCDANLNGSPLEYGKIMEAGDSLLRELGEE